MKHALGLVGWLLLTFAAAWIGSQFMPGEWYAGLNKPSWNPPNWIFGPVWTVLYLLMAISAWMVWKEAGFDGARLALGLFVGQLALNALWSYLFFGRLNPGAALIDIVILGVAIAATIVAFRTIRPLAAGLLVPYLLWVLFATALNFQIWKLNA